MFVIGCGGFIMARFLAYMRCSTNKQFKSHYGLDAQRADIIKHVESVGGELVDSDFIEVESGRKSDKKRNVLADAIKMAKKLDATLITAKMDRFSRSVSFISQVLESNTSITFCDMPDASTFQVHLMACFAEHEAKEISARTKKGLAEAKKKGVKLGNRILIEGGHAARWNSKQKNEAVTKSAKLKSSIENIIASGTRSKLGITKKLNELGHRNEKGNKFHSQTVSRIMERLEI